MHVQAQDPGPSLALEGYHPVPIPKGVKRPVIPAWQGLRLSAAEWQAQYAGMGVGLLCGVGAVPLCALDVDCLDSDAAQEFEDWCLSHLGDAPVRIGLAPKRLLVYRAAQEGWAKRSSALLQDAEGRRTQLEMLGKGQQFVAYGQHPDTKQPYYWTDWAGGLLSYGIDKLNTVTQGQLDEAVQTFESIVVAHGGRVSEKQAASSTAFAVGGDDLGLMAVGPSPNKAGMTLDEAKRLIAEFSATEYKQWLRVGMALHHEFDGSADALKAWDVWSSQAESYKGLDDLRRRWVKFGKDHRSQVVTLTMLLREVQRLPLTEFGMSVRMVQNAQGRMRYVTDTGRWFLQRGPVWVDVPQEMIERLATNTVMQLPQEAVRIKKQGDEDLAKATFKFAHKAQTAGMVSSMLRLSKAAENVAIQAQDLDPDMRMLAVQNGLLDTHTGALQAATAAVYTRVASVAFDPAAQCPLFEQTVSDCFFGDPDMIGFLQRIMGYSLLGASHRHEQVMLIPYGRGANGKSTVFNAIKYALGSHATVASAGTLLAAPRTGGESSGGPREDLLRLRAARLVYVNEPAEGSLLREELIKSLTGGEAIIARGMFAPRSIEFTPTWLTVMPTNHKPIIKGTDIGIWRRLLLLPFERNFDADPDLKKDALRTKKLEAEAAGILRWCVQGALDYVQSGLQVPLKVRAAVDAYRSEMDVLGDWLEECCEEGATHVCASSDLWQSWSKYANAAGSFSLCSSQKKLTMKLVEKGFARKKGGHGERLLTGLRLNASQAAVIDNSDSGFDGTF